MTAAPNAPFNMARYCIGKAAAETPEKAALLVYNVPNASEPVEAWRFADIEKAVLQFAAALANLGLQPGDRVAIRLGNTSRSALLFLALSLAGSLHSQCPIS